MGQQEESQSTPALIRVPEFNPETCSTSLGIIPENNLLESYTRLSISLEENGLFKGSSRSSSSSATTSHHMTLEELRAVNRYAESTKSLSYLPQVHERQTARMRTRSEWFLSPLITPGKLLCTIDSDPTSIYVLRGSNNRSSSGNMDLLLSLLANKGGTALSASAESVQKRPSVRRTSSRHGHRPSSKRNKENGAKKHSPQNSFKSKDRNDYKNIKFSCYDSKPRQENTENRCLKETTSNEIILKEGDRHNGSQKILKMSSLDAPKSKFSPESCKFQKMSSLEHKKSPKGETKQSKSSPQLSKQMNIDVTEEDCTEMDVQTFHVTLTYKPRV